MAEAEHKDFKHIVRIANTDLAGNKHVMYGLTGIKGVGYMFSHAVCRVADVDTTKILGKLTKDEVSRLDAALRAPDKHGIPEYMYNRRKDYQTGEHIHLLTNELAFCKENDLKRMKKIKSYRGIRHMFNQPVRGQRTRSNFRHNKGKVLGVKRKKK